MNQYLTEEKLEHYLNFIFSENKWIRDKIVLNSGLKYRPDYYCKELNLIVEFDGDCFGYKGHYSSIEVIYKDLKKDKRYNEMGIKVIRIPYFVQMSSLVIKNLFKKDIEIKQTYLHGFIDKDAKLPVDYNEAGIEKFKIDLDKFAYIKNDIILSLKNKINEKANIDLVLPKSLQYLVS